MGVGLRTLTSLDGEDIMCLVIEELKENTKGLVRDFDCFEGDVKTILRAASQRLIPLAGINQAHKAQVGAHATRMLLIASDSIGLCFPS